MCDSGHRSLLIVTRFVLRRRHQHQQTGHERTDQAVAPIHRLQRPHQADDGLLQVRIDVRHAATENRASGNRKGRPAHTCSSSSAHHASSRRHCGLPDVVCCEEQVPSGLRLRRRSPTRRVARERFVQTQRRPQSRDVRALFGRRGFRPPGKLGEQSLEPLAAGCGLCGFTGRQIPQRRHLLVQPRRPVVSP